MSIIIRTFVGDDTSPHDAAAHAQHNANTFLLTEQIEWKQVRHISTNLAIEEGWSYFNITLVIELPEDRGVELMQA